jgi:hypothetical protein
MISQSEQRRFIRMNLECEVKYRFSDSQRFFLGICKNFSSSGLLFSCPHSLDVGQILEVWIVPTDNVTPTMRFLARVVFIKPTTASNLFDIATEIEGTI